MSLRRRLARGSLAVLYAELNGRFWQGQLPAPVPRGVYNPRAVTLLRVSTRLDVAGGFDGLPFKALSFKGVRRCAGRFIAPGTYRPAHIHVLGRIAAEEERRILLHEMVHCYLHFAGFPTDGHGPRFVAELERLASMGEAWAGVHAADYRQPEVPNPPPVAR